MILGIDPGARTFGWAVTTLAPARVLELGELHQPDASGTSRGAANTARVNAQAKLLAEVLARYPGITTIAGEARSLQRGPAAVSMAAAQSSCWGMLAGLAALRGLALVEVGPKVWQAAVLGRSDDLDYDDVARVLAAFVKGDARAQLLAIPPGRRNHALDACGVGAFVAAGMGGEVVVRGLSVLPMPGWSVT